jgi:hypothetical protein
VYTGDYNLRFLRGYAKADFEFLRKNLLGKPDKIKADTRTDIGTRYIPLRL